VSDQREDYILRLIDELRQFVAQVLARRDETEMNEALLAVVHAEEKLFGCPAAEFATPDVHEQLAMLTEGETPEVARTKRLAYASFLQEAAFIYEARGEGELALSAFQLALYITLMVAADLGPRAVALRPAIDQLVGRLPMGQLHAPVRELLNTIYLRNFTGGNFGGDNSVIPKRST
jgi:hypothetical protein